MSGVAAAVGFRCPLQHENRRPQLSGGHGGAKRSVAATNDDNIRRICKWKHYRHPKKKNICSKFCIRLYIYRINRLSKSMGLAPAIAARMATSLVDRRISKIMRVRPNTRGCVRIEKCLGDQITGAARQGEN